MNYLQITFKQTQTHTNTRRCIHTHTHTHTQLRLLFLLVVKPKMSTTQTHSHRSVTETDCLSSAFTVNGRGRSRSSMEHSVLRCCCGASTGRAPTDVYSNLLGDRESPASTYHSENNMFLPARWECACPVFILYTTFPELSGNGAGSLLGFGTFSAHLRNLAKKNNNIIFLFISLLYI